MDDIDSKYPTPATREVQVGFWKAAAASKNGIAIPARTEELALLRRQIYHARPEGWKHYFTIMTPEGLNEVWIVKRGNPPDVPPSG